MYLPTTLVLLLLAYEAPLGYAFEFAPHRSFVRATERLHGIAKRGSAGFARDLRLAMRGLNLQQDVVQNPMQADKVYCVRPDSFNEAARNETGTSPATGAGGGTAAGTATGTSGPAASSAVPTSAFKLVQSYVCGCSYFLIFLITKLCAHRLDRVSSMDGRSGICQTRQTVRLSVYFVYPLMFYV